MFALATVTLAQNAPQITSNSDFKVVQNMTQPTPADVRSKVSKSKVKRKTKGDKGSGNGGAGKPAPAGGVGPPDPGKYL